MASAMNGGLEWLWAKSPAPGGPPDRYHPLVCHMLDVAAVAEALWDRWLKPPVRRRLGRLLGADDGEARTWLALVAGLHDLGKCTPAFQVLWPGALPNLAAAGLTGSPIERIGHGTASCRLIADELRACCPGLPARSCAALALAVGGHHGVFPAEAELRSARPMSYGTGAWSEARRSLVLGVAEFAGARLDAPPMAACHSDLPGLALLAGLACVADWIGSNEEHFPHSPPPLDLEAYARLARGRARAAVEELGFAGWQPPGAPADFAELFPAIAEPRALQVAAGHLAARASPPRLVVVEAPMGEGKTEAAVLLADAANARLHQAGVYVGLPTMATANAMYGRFGQYLRGRYPDHVNFRLLHGQAMLCDGPLEYRREAVRGAEAMDADCAVPADEWFSHRKRGLLAPMAVGTVDQALMAILQTPHVFVRLLGLAGKTIIVDEVHAYDTYTSTLLERLLGWLAALDCSVVLLSATLPRARRQALVDAYGGATSAAAAAAYPRLTHTADGAAASVHFPASRTHTIGVEWVGGGAGLAGSLGAELRDGGCAAVVCNTVHEAQETYRALRDALGPDGVEVSLFHARFPLGRRLELEDEVLRRFGPPGQASRPARAVLVATQVVEQSLDLDFDLLVTELAPVDLVLQRAGRMHRHNRPGRPARHASPRLWLMSPELGADALPQFGSSQWVYGEFPLLMSWLALRHRASITLPEDVEPLIESVYVEGCPGATGDSGLDARLARAWAEMEKRREALEDRAREVCLPRPTSTKGLSALTRMELEEDNPEMHAAFRALTRWSDAPSVELVCLHGTPDRAYLDAQCAAAIDLSSEPDAGTLDQLLRLSVSITGHRWLQAFGPSSTPTSWHKHAVLRHRRIVLFVDGSCETPFGPLRLDGELGLVLPRAKEGADA